MHPLEGLGPEFSLMDVRSTGWLDSEGQALGVHVCGAWYCESLVLIVDPPLPTIS